MKTRSLLKKRGYGKNYLSAKQRYYSVCKLGFLFDLNWIQHLVLTVMNNETRQRSSSDSKLIDDSLTLTLIGHGFDSQGVQTVSFT